MHVRFKTKKGGIQYRKMKRGFGISELLIVLVVIGILSSAYLLSFADVTDNVKSKADEANLRTLNSATKIFKELYPSRNYDIFYGTYSNSARMQLLVESDCLVSKSAPEQKNATFIWSIPKQEWILVLSKAEPPLSPLGSSFEEISSEMIDLITQFYIDHGSYPRNWGEFKYSDIGLTSSDWDEPIDHIYYAPAGSLIRIRPEEGYSFTFEFGSGASGELEGDSNWDLIYNDKDKKWYFHSIEPANEIKIETLSVLQ